VKSDHSGISVDEGLEDTRLLPTIRGAGPKNFFRNPYLFNKAHLQEFGDALQAWMISQIPGGAEGLDQLVCDGKTLRGSAIETEDGNHRFVAQVTVYARALGVALAQKTYDTHESSEKAVLKELLSSLDLDGVLIQADALHTTQAFFAGAWSRGPTSC
jgi:hypothetical protein